MGRRNRAGGGGRDARCRRPVRAARQRECGARPLRRRNARATLDVAGEGVRAAAHPRSNVQTLMRSAFGCSGVRVFGCSGVRVFGCSGVRVFGCSGVRVFGCSGVRVFGQGGRRRRAALGPASLGQRTFNPRASDCRSARRLPALRPTTARVSRPRANRRNAARPVPAPPRRATHHPSARFARRARSRGVLPQLFAHVSCSSIL